jgi:hypothetical protein
VHLTRATRVQVNAKPIGLGSPAGATPKSFRGPGRRIVDGGRPEQVILIASAALRWEVQSRTTTPMPFSGLDEAKFSKCIELSAIKSTGESAAALLPAKG